MSENLDVAAKRIGDKLIDISDVLDTKMEKWSSASQRPDNLSDTECVGFVNRESVPSAVNLVVDIQAPADSNQATLRIWGIASKRDDTGHERFNNIQLDFDMDYAAARVITQKTDRVTRDDIRVALHEPNTQLSHLVVGNQSGFDEASQQQLGKRYDIPADELDQYDSINAVVDTLNPVLAALTDAAAADSSTATA